ncbi:MAG: Endonuclease VIII, partial [uncultured Acidimicrobiales bacterium]
ARGTPPAPAGPGPGRAGRQGDCRHLTAGPVRRRCSPARRPPPRIGRGLREAPPPPVRRRRGSGAAHPPRHAGQVDPPGRRQAAETSGPGAPGHSRRGLGPHRPRHLRAHGPGRLGGAGGGAGAGSPGRPPRRGAGVEGRHVVCRHRRRRPARPVGGRGRRKRAAGREPVPGRHPPVPSRLRSRQGDVPPAVGRADRPHGPERRRRPHHQRSSRCRGAGHRRRGRRAHGLQAGDLPGLRHACRLLGAGRPHRVRLPALPARL